MEASWQGAVVAFSRAIEFVVSGPGFVFCGVATCRVVAASGRVVASECVEASEFVVVVGGFFGLRSRAASPPDVAGFSFPYEGSVTSRSRTLGTVKTNGVGRVTGT